MCYHASTFEDLQVSDELLRKFWQTENPFLQEPELSQSTEDCNGVLRVDTLSRREGKVCGTFTFEK